MPHAAHDDAPSPFDGCAFSANADGHPMDCNCPGCDPDAYEDRLPAEAVEALIMMGVVA